MDTETEFDPDRSGCSVSSDLKIIRMQKQQKAAAKALPELRESAKKFNRFCRRKLETESDYAINTSALDRAFPDFTGDFTPPDNDSASIEAARGQTKTNDSIVSQPARSASRPPNPEPNDHDSTFEFVAPISQKRSTATPPLTMPKTRNLPEAIRRNPVRNRQPRRPSSVRTGVDDTPPITKARDNGSGSSRQTSDENRQTITAINARIQKEMNASQISEERPPSAEPTARSSRFTGGRRQASYTQSEPLPGRFASKQSFASATPDQYQTGTQAELKNDASQLNNSTYQPLPPLEMINPTEDLVSVTYDANGVPKLSRNYKPRVLQRAISRQSSRPDPSPVEDIDVPNEEQNIVAQLKSSREAVAELLQYRSETEIYLCELQAKYDRLVKETSRRKSRQRSDSAIGLTDGGSDAGDEIHDRRKLTLERNRKLNFP